MTQHTQKIALVTGSSRGLGKNTALTLAQKGIDVIVTYRSSEAEANAVVSTIESMGRKAAALQLDSANTQTFKDFVGQVKQSLPAFTKLNNADDEIENIPQVGSENSLSEQILEYLETDPHQLLQKHIRAHPEATFQFIVLKRLEGISWQELSNTLNIGIPALSNFFQRNLQKIAPEIRKYIQE